MRHIRRKPKMPGQRPHVLIKVFQPQEMPMLMAARIPHVACTGPRPQCRLRVVMPHKSGEIMRLCVANSRMIKRLRAQPMVIADHPVPRVAHKAKAEHRADFLGAQRPVQIRQCRVFPDPPARCLGQLGGARLAALCLGGVADQDVVSMRPRLQRQRHRGAAGLGYMHKDEPASGG